MASLAWERGGHMNNELGSVRAGPSEYPGPFCCSILYNFEVRQITSDIENILSPEMYNLPYYRAPLTLADLSRLTKALKFFS